MKIIGSAADFYRVRVMSIDTTDDLDLEWRDDVLYRRPLADLPHEERAINVEAVALDDEERAVVIASFESSAEATAWAEERQVELAELTKSDFEERYFPGDSLA